MNDDSKRRHFERRWQSRFAEFARLRDDDAGIAGWSVTGLETRFRFFTNLWHETKAGALYVDLGCGAGTYSRWLAGRGLQVVGVDYSQLALVKARQRDFQQVDYCAADASRLPFRDQSVDGVLCFGVLQAVWESSPFVLEIARILKPGGEIWIDALNVNGIRARWDISARSVRGKPMHLRYESPAALMTLLRTAGFINLSRYWLPILPAQLSRFQTLCETRIVRAALAVLPFLGSIVSHAFVVQGELGRTNSELSSPKDRTR